MTLLIIKHFKSKYKNVPIFYIRLRFKIIQPQNLLLLINSHIYIHMYMDDFALFCDKTWLGLLNFNRKIVRT